VTSPTETYAATNRDLDDMGNALLNGAGMAPRLTIDTIIALRSVLARHRPVERDRFKTLCAKCGIDWMQCSDAQDVLKVMGLPEDDDEGREY
jgi:hypothetical protein